VEAQACATPSPKESPMHEEEETEPMEEQEQPMEEGDDDPHLDLKGDQET